MRGFQGPRDLWCASELR